MLRELYGLEINRSLERLRGLTFIGSDHLLALFSLPLSLPSFSLLEERQMREKDGEKMRRR